MRALIRRDSSLVLPSLASTYRYQPTGGLMKINNKMVSHTQDLIPFLPFWENWVTQWSIEFLNSMSWVYVSLAIYKFMGVECPFSYSRYLSKYFDFQTPGSFSYLHTANSKLGANSWPLKRGLVVETLTLNLSILLKWWCYKYKLNFLHRKLCFIIALIVHTTINASYSFRAYDRTTGPCWPCLSVPCLASNQNHWWDPVWTGTDWLQSRSSRVPVGSPRWVAW